MERKYNVIIGLLAVLAIASLAGFLKTYLVYFPRFEGVSGATHFHFRPLAKATRQKYMNTSSRKELLCPARHSAMLLRSYLRS